MKEVPADIAAIIFGEGLNRPQYIERGRCDKAKRIEVLKRDNHACVECGEIEGLHVHHKLWDKGKAVDEVDQMETLCHNCHGVLHDKARSA